MNGSQEIEEYQKSTTTQKWAKDNSKTSPVESDSPNFMYLDHQCNTFQDSMQGLETNYCISLRNNGIYNQADKQTID